MAIDFSYIDKSFNFETYEPSILGGTRRKSKILAILDYDTAALIRPDIYAVHKKIYNFIKDYGTPNDPRSYKYVKLINANGVQEVLGIPWINQNTMVETAVTNVVVTIPDRGHESVSLISTLLLSGDITGFTIEVK